MHVFIGAFMTFFKALMVWDAISRRGCCNNQWYFIIIFVPFGEWIYFFSVKIHDPQMARLLRRFKLGRTSLDKLRYDAEHCPSHENRLRLARALYDHQRDDEACTVADSLLKSDPQSKDAAYVKSRALLRRERVDDAIGLLEGIINQDFAFREYEAVRILADVYSGREQHEKAIPLLEKLLKKSNRVPHALALARELSYVHRFDEAEKLLQKSLDDARFAPKFTKRQDRNDVREANRLLRRLAAAPRTGVNGSAVSGSVGNGGSAANEERVTE